MLMSLLVSWLLIWKMKMEINFQKLQVNRSFCLWQVITRFLFSSWENYPSLPTSASSRLHFHYDLSVVYQHLAWGFHKHSQALRFLFEQTDLNRLTRERKQTIGLSEEGQHVVLISLSCFHHDYSSFLFALSSISGQKFRLLSYVGGWHDSLDMHMTYTWFFTFDDPLNENLFA